MTGALAVLLDNARRAPIILLLGLVSCLVYAALIGVGDLSTRLPVYYAAHALLIGLMLVAWRRVSRSGHGLHLAILTALVFRLIAAFAEPSLSDDVYRYVWDGRVQLHGSGCRSIQQNHQK